MFIVSDPAKPDGVNRKLIRDKDYIEMVQEYFFEGISA